jgi:hypothetical protein
MLIEMIESTDKMRNEFRESMKLEVETGIILKPSSEIVKTSVDVKDSDKANALIEAYVLDNFNLFKTYYLECSKNILNGFALLQELETAYQIRDFKRINELVDIQKIGHAFMAYHNLVMVKKDAELKEYRFDEQPMNQSVQMFELK